MTDGQQAHLTGGCLCGAVRYSVSAEPLAAVHCYCIDCRRSSGTGHSTHAVFQEAAFSVSGELKIYERPANSGTPVRRHFCPDCGAPICSTGGNGSGLVFLRVSSLDDPDAVTPKASVYARRAPLWDPVDPSLPSFPEMPSREQREAMLRQE